VSTFQASVSAGAAGPVVILSGEADLRSAGQLSELLTVQLATGVERLQVDVSGLSFIDSASRRALVLARPQPVVMRVLELMGADQVIDVQGAAAREPDLGEQTEGI
jgi:anti-anti-sigma regulatory factor